MRKNLMIVQDLDGEDLKVVLLEEDGGVDIKIKKAGAKDLKRDLYLIAHLEEDGDVEMKRKVKVLLLKISYQNFLQNLPQIIEKFGQENPMLFWKLHKLSLRCLDSQDKEVLQKGKDLLLKMLEISPNHQIALYNLACAESLLGNVTEALSTLEQAIDAGYHDLYHMTNDKDFENIKNNDGFYYLIQKLDKILFPNETTQEPEQKKEESKKEPEVKKNETNQEPEQKKEEKPKDPLEEKINTLEQIFQLPRDLLRDLLMQHKDNVEVVISKLLN